MNRVTFFTKPDCTLCGGAWFVIDRVRAQIPFDVEQVDISAPGNEKWFEAYKHDIPVVHLNGQEIFRHRVDEKQLRRLLALENTAPKEDSPPAH